MKPLSFVRAALARTGFRVLLPLLLSLGLFVSAMQAEPIPPSQEPISSLKEPLKIVASIKPLALMVEEVAGEHAEVTVLVRPGQTPHDFAFKVSDRQRLSQADLLVWVGPALEPYLAGLSPGREQLSMATVLDIEGTHHHGHDDDHGHGHGHGHGHADQHFWLNPAYGKAMVTAIADALARLDPPHTAIYQHNAERIGQQLLAIPVTPATQGNAATERRYAIVHQAFDHFLDYFPYSRPMMLTPVPEVSPGARQLWQASQQLQSGDCLMVESKSPGKWVQTFAERNDLQLKLIDIMGYTEEVNTYTQLLEGVKSVFDECAQ